MEYMQAPATSSQGNILCCTCGIPIPPNPANMCVSCLRTTVDISEGIPKQVNLHFCKQCERYLQPPASWVQCALESRELIPSLLCSIYIQTYTLVDGSLACPVQVMNGAILQQVFVVEFVIQGQMCDDCHRVEAKDFWNSVVQVRQKTSHKKTFYYLEQLILKHKLHQNALNIKEIHEGIDFYYATKQHAQKMVDFLQCTVPCRSKTSQRLISHDIHSNTFNYKSTYSIEIVPVCKDNVVCLSPRLAQSLGNMGQVCVCARVTSTIHLIDPNTLQIAEVDGGTYWRNPFNSLVSPRQLEEFIVMDTDIIRNQKLGAGAGIRSNKHTLAEVWVQKTSEMDTAQQYHCRTHLGHLLNIGDLVQGFDFANSNVNDEFLNKMSPSHIPDVVLIKKSYNRSKRVKRRNWKLKEMDKDREGMAPEDERESEGWICSISRQYQDFLEDLEEDEALRKNVNIFRDASKIPVESDTDDEGAPRISLMEMLEDLSLTDATGGEGADMLTE
uniref:60S ribosomal export protein NMD3 n=1 Tax=Oncorhynchus mykiss TaxID=8022 RepID=A0A8C7UL65_ONCMY